MKRRILLILMILVLVVTPLALAKPAPAKVKKIMLSSTSLTLEEGVSEELSVTFKPAKAQPQLKWSSNNKDVATVSDDGIVTAVGAGTAVVKVITKNGKSARCVITVPDRDKIVALTYDDGPCANTMKLLEVLKKHDAKATFFVLGERVNDRPDYAKAIVDAGNEIASHTVDHKSLQKISLADARWQVTQSLDSIEKATGVRAKLMRAPYGAIDNELAAKLAQTEPITFVQWSVDPEDWKDRDAKTVYDRVISNVKPGRIILMHDLYESTTQATDKIITTLKKEGYSFVTVSELLEHRQVGDPVGTVVF